MLLSDGVDSQQSMLATALNHLVTDGALRAGSIVQLQDITCNNIEGRRCTCVLLSPLATDWILLLICFRLESFVRCCAWGLGCHRLQQRSHLSPKKIRSKDCIL